MRKSDSVLCLRDALCDVWAKVVTDESTAVQRCWRGCIGNDLRATSLGYTVDSGESEARDLIYDAVQFRHPLLPDIEHARQSVVISSPHVSTKGIHEWKPTLLAAVKLGIRVEIRTKEMTVYKKSAMSVDRALNALFGIRVLMSNDTFLKYVIIDERVVWYGSMDMLGTIPPDSSVLRLSSRSIAARFVKTDHS